HAVRGSRRKRDPIDTAQPDVVSSREFAAALLPRQEMAELTPADGSLDVGHIGLDPRLVHRVPPLGAREVPLPGILAHAVKPGSPDVVGYVRAVRGDYPSLADWEVLGRIEAEAGGRGDRADGPVSGSRAKGVGSVLDDQVEGQTRGLG